MARRFALVALLAVILAVAGTYSEASAQLLSVDFGRDVPPATPVQSGFTGIAGGSVASSHTDVVGAYSVTVEGGGFFNAGFNAGNVGASVAPLFEDYYYNNATDPGVGIKVTIAGVTPNTEYNLKLWSYDEDNIFSVTPTQWGPAAGSATTGTSGLVSDSGAAPFPTTLDEKTTTLRLTSTTNELAFFGSSTGGGGGTRLNGFRLSLVPEPTGAALGAAVAASLAALRRKNVCKR